MIQCHTSIFASQHTRHNSADTNLECTVALYISYLVAIKLINLWGFHWFCFELVQENYLRNLPSKPWHQKRDCTWILIATVCLFAWASVWVVVHNQMLIRLSNAVNVGIIGYSRIHIWPYSKVFLPPFWIKPNVNSTVSQLRYSRITFNCIQNTQTLAQTLTQTDAVRSHSTPIAPVSAAELTHD